MVALDEAIEKLSSLDETHARLVELRFFAGLTVPEIGTVLGISERQVGREWAIVRAWLGRELNDWATNDR